jgi:hypothetical protein
VCGLVAGDLRPAQCLWAALRKLTILYMEIAFELSLVAEGRNVRDFQTLREKENFDALFAW